MDTRAISSTIQSFRTRLAAIAVLLMVVVVYIGVATGLRHATPEGQTSAAVWQATVSAQAARDLAMVMEEQRRERLSANEQTASVDRAVQAAHEGTLARLRDLNTSGDPALDAGLLLLPEHMPGQRSGPY